MLELQHQSFLHCKAGLFSFGLFIYLLDALGIFCFCSGFFSSCSKQGLLFAAEHGSRALGLSSCGTGAQLPTGMWNIPGPVIKPVLPALTGRFLSTAPPGKSQTGS